MSQAIDVGMYPEELPPQCREWKRFWGGKEAFQTAEKRPDTWLPVLDLMPREVALIVLFPWHRVQPERMRQSLMYASAEERFCAWPTHLLKGVAARRGPVAKAIKFGASWLKLGSVDCRLPLSIGPIEFWSAVLAPVWRAVTRPVQSLQAVVSFLRSLRLSWGRNAPAVLESDARA